MSCKRLGKVAKRAAAFSSLKSQCGADTVVVGHSSGALAAMRFAESTPVLGLMLIAAAHTDGGIESERASGYYSRSWLWASIRANCRFILQAHSVDDPCIPVSEGDFMAEQLHSQYVRFPDRSHFFAPESVREVPSLIRDTLRKLDAAAATP